MLDGGETQGSRSVVLDVMRKHKKEANIIRKGGFESSWESGFWSGVCATGRLFSGVACPTSREEGAAATDLACLEMDKPWKEYTEDEKDAVEVRNVKQAWRDFPMLDS